MKMKIDKIADKRSELKKQLKKTLVSLGITVVLLVIFCFCIYANAASVSVDLGDGENQGIIDLLFLITALALAPSILVMMTSFTRFIIVLSFLRNALGTQQSPPNQVLIGISVFLTLAVMWPVIDEINQTAYKPYKEGTIEQQEFLDIAAVPIKQFMIKQTYENDLSLFLAISPEGTSLEERGIDKTSLEELSTLGLEIIVPSFVTSELKRAFNIGFLLFIPFLIIDIVVSSTLMSMGMVMLPPSMISLPFKIMVFVLVDGWSLLFANLVKGFR